MEKLRQLWLTEMQVKYTAEHSGITYTKERGRSGLLPSVSSFSEVYSKLSRVLRGPQQSSAQDSHSQVRSQAFLCMCCKDHWKPKVLLRVFPSEGKHALAGTSI